MSLATLVKKLQDIMRKDAGVDGDVQRLNQLVWMVFLMVFDYMEEEAELSEDFEPVIPEGYRWRDWALCRNDDGRIDIKNQLTGNALLEFVNTKLFPVLSGEPIRNENGEQVIPFTNDCEQAALVKSVMRESSNFMKNGYMLREVINELAQVDFSSSYDVHQFNEIYESLLKSLQAAGTMGEFYTNRAITRFCVDHVDPQLGETVGDWACGTGGFLVDAYEHLEAQVPQGDVEARRALQSALKGGEWKAVPYRLAVTNLMLHGIDVPDIRFGDSLAEKPFNEYRGNDLVGFVLMNPPYGGTALPEDRNSFPGTMRSSETADLFLALAVKRLKKGGKGAIVLPDGFLFGNDNQKVAVKEYLTKECNLHTIVRLPQSCFAPYTNIATNLLFFDKVGPTEEIWFYRLDLPNGQKFSKTKNPMKREHFREVDDWWDDRTEIKDAGTDTYKAKKFRLAEIKANDFNLDLCGYPNAEEEILSPEETIRSFMQRRAQLNQLMDEKLAQIAALLEVK